MKSVRNRKSYVVWAGLALSLLLAPALTLQAAEKPLGIVVFIKGKVEIKRAGKNRRVKRHNLVHTGDEIRTSKTAKVSVQFGDGAIFSVGPDTTLVIKSLQDIRQKRLIHMNMKKGSVAGKVRKGKYDVSIKTPAAIAGVRGTEFIVEARDAATKVLVNQGEVRVTSADGKNEAMVQAGKKIEADVANFQQSIMEEHEKQKFKIVEQFDKQKESNFQALVEQQRRTEEMFEEQERRNKELFDKQNKNP